MPTPAQNDAAIAFRGFRKAFGETLALDGLDLEVRTGTITGLVGPNGSGKTTAIRAICGLLQPTGGSVDLLGVQAYEHRHALRPLVGYMPQSAALYEDLSALENVEFFALALNARRPYDRARELVELIGLAERAGAPVHTLSGGMRQRVSLACAMVHDPAVLLLDEPTAGVDPALRRSFWDHFRELRDRGTTLLVSTNQLDEAMHFDRLAILRRGRLLASDTPAHVLDLGRAHVTIAAGPRQIEADTSDYAVELPRLLAKHGLSPEVATIRIERETLEDVVVRLAAEAEAEASAQETRSAPEGRDA